jgi:phosphoribosyl 1,2-cyclic phosphodiesterase
MPSWLEQDFNELETWMSLSFCVLASGSSGNCTAVGWHEHGRARWILIDAGLSPRMTATRLHSVGISLRDVSDILLTHLDWDHCHAGWHAALERFGLTVHVHRRHQRVAGRCGLPVRSTCVFDDSIRLGDVIVQGSVLAHDALGSIAYLVQHGQARLGLATDLGRVPHSLFQQFRDLDALAIESNYDPAMQEQSARPQFLKRRIMGGSGHLSNAQALDAVLEIDRQSKLQHIALLHLSSECNCPLVVSSLYRHRAPHLADRITITGQHEPTTVMHLSSAPRACRDDANACQQLSLFATAEVG